VYKIVYTKQAVKDAKQLKAAGLTDKTKVLIEKMRENPFITPPRYESLVGNLAGLFSRRINIQHRLVYQVYNNPFMEQNVHYQGTIKIIRMWTHYEHL